MRYWLSIGDGTSYGPYTLEELRAYASDGRVHADCMLCADGDSAWVAAGTVIAGLSAPPPPAVDAARTSPHQAFEPVRRIGLFWSIVATVGSVLFCCLPLGLGAVITAIQANTKYANGDTIGGAQAERAYRVWLTISLFFVAIGLLLTYWSVRAMLDMLNGVSIGL